MGGDTHHVQCRRAHRTIHRLRLWIRWASLGDLVRGLTARGNGEASLKAMPATNVDRRKSGIKEMESSLSPVSPGTPPPELVCRVMWCGNHVANVQLSPHTGLPITAGECLLLQPSGLRWELCSLAIEVFAVASSQYPMNNT
ncbi:unnamed protein product, partial [Choristocarpus tenellus]